MFRSSSTTRILSILTKLADTQFASSNFLPPRGPLPGVSRLLSNPNGQDGSRQRLHGDFRITAAQGRGRPREGPTSGPAEPACSVVTAHAVERRVSAAGRVLRPV